MLCLLFTYRYSVADFVCMKSKYTSQQQNRQITKVQFELKSPLVEYLRRPVKMLSILNVIFNSLLPLTSRFHSQAHQIEILSIQPYLLWVLCKFRETTD